MEVLTIEHSAFQQLISKIDAMDEFIRKAKFEQQSSLDDDWVDGQAVCEYLCICDKTLQRLRSAGKITYSTIGNKYYYQIAEIKRCLRAHTIKSSEEMLQNLIAHKRLSQYTPTHQAALAKYSRRVIFYTSTTIGQLSCNSAHARSRRCSSPTVRFGSIESNNPLRN